MVLSSLTLQHFQCFLSIAEHGTMIKASEYLNISQPLMSQKIAQLETELGVKLFSRYKRRLQLTDAGIQFLDDCRAFMNAIDAACENLSIHFPSNSDKSIRIGFSDGHEPSNIKQVVTMLKESFPDTKIAVDIDNRLLITDKLLNGEIDFCYMVDTERLHASKSVGYRRLYHLSVNCIVSKSSHLTQKQSFMWQDLNGLTCYWPNSLKNTMFTKDIQKLLRAKEVNLTFDFRDVDYFTLRRYLYVDDCITLTLSRSLDDPMLKILPMGELAYPFVIAWKKEDSKQLERFVERFMSISKSLTRRQLPE